MEPISPITKLKFFIWGNNQVLNNSVFSHHSKGLTSSEIYENKGPKEGGLIDRRTGTTNLALTCNTCNLTCKDCPGHFGHILLKYPMFHIGFITYVRTILNCICHNCGRLRCTNEKKDILKSNINKLSNEQLYELSKKYCLNGKKCVNCDANLLNFTIYPNKTEGKLLFIAERKTSDEKLKIEFNQKNVYDLLAKIPDEDARLLGFNPSVNRPTDLMFTVFPVSPVCIRPSVRIEGTNTTSENDITRQLAYIYKQNEGLINAYANGRENDKEIYKSLLQQGVAAIIDNDNQYTTTTELKKKPMKSFVDRLKSKDGRIQCNLMGTRVNYCGRAVLTGDSSININEVGIPIYIAKILTRPEYATPENIERLRKYVKNGKDKYPGANSLIPKKYNYERTYDTEIIKDTMNVEIGDLVERHLIDGDVVLFNRQPTLHKYSMMAHYAKIINNKKYASLRLNVGTTTPYNADYDGDEMNIFIPRTDQSRIELEELIAVQKLLINEQTSSMSIGCKLDNVSGPYLMSLTDKIFSKKDVMNFLAITEPPIDKIDDYLNLKKNEYIGKEILSFIIPKNVNLKEKNVEIKNGQIINGFLGKSTLSSGQANSLIRLILDLYNSEEARKFFDNIQRLSNKYLEYRGFSSSLNDIIYTDELTNKTKDLIKNCLLKINYEVSETENDPSLNTYENLEKSILSIENNIRDVIGQMIINNFNKGNALDIYMRSESASKISVTSVCQDCSLVGQDIQKNIGTRFMKKDMRRTLPYYNRDLDTAYERGFTTTGFLQGIDFPSFVFAGIASRESLIIERLKTADSGYFEKKIVKALEDSKIQNDRTVRNTTNMIIQFVYGDNGLAADKQYLHKISFLTKNDKEINEMGKGNKKYIDKVIKLKQEILKTRIDVKLNILNINNLYNFYTCINDNKIKSLMVEGKKKIDIEYLLDKLKSFDKNLNILLNGSDKNFKVRYDDNKFDKIITSAVLYDIFNPKAVIDEYKIDKETLDKIINIMVHDSKFNLAFPGKSVGVIAAQSMSEKITQTNLRAHHAIGQKNTLTGGFDRLKEIISLSKKIKSPSMTIKFKDEYANNIKYIKHIESFINQINLNDLRNEIKFYYDPNKDFEKEDNIKNVFIKSNSKCNWLIRINLNKEFLTEKGITIENILTQITDTLQNQKNKDKSNKFIFDSIIDFQCQATDDYVNQPIIHIRLNLIKYNMNVIQSILDNIIDKIKINGIKNINNCFINDEETKNYKYIYDEKENKIIQKEEKIIITNGINLDDIRLIKGVDSSRTLINDFNMIYEYYGIEALRNAMLDEFMKNTEDNIKYNHVSLLFDYMTCKGFPISIDRGGLNKAGGSLCGIISFEESINALINAAIFEKEDNIEGISSRLMTGRNINAGTGFNQVILDTNMLINSENEFEIKNNNNENNNFNDFINGVVGDNDFDEFLD